MAKYTHPFGLISGKIGDKIACIRNGKQYFRTVSKSKNRNVSQQQQKQRLRFSLVSSFLSPLRNVLDSLPGYGTKTKYQYAFSQISNNALAESENNILSIHFSEVKLCTGNSLAVFNHSLQLHNHILKCRYGFKIQGNKFSEALLLIYSVKREHWICSEFSMLEFPDECAVDLLSVSDDDQFECYLVFLDRNSKKCSPSYYLGCAGSATYKYH